MEPYRAPAPPTANNPWIYVGPASSILDISSTPDSKTTKLSTTQPASDSSTDIFASPEITTPCKILQLASSPGSAEAQELTPDAAQNTIGFQPQILVFRYRGKLHAIDHSCPHRNFPLSRGSVYDIEDFGVVLSSGIECPKHGWSFDLHTGKSDRGGYQLKIWEVETRSGENGFGEVEEEVWVRRKEKKRIG